jgi:pyochelin biosynthetic protein PchC
MAGLADAVADAAGILTDRPVAFFGHSMGAAVAYEVTRRLELRAPGAVRALFVSGRPAPEIQRTTRSAVHLRGDDGLADEVAVLGGTDADVLAHPELRAHVLPVLRNDFRLIETYRPARAGPLDVPVVALTGDADPRMEVAHAAAWAAETTRAFRLAVFGGGHFYLVPHRRAVIATVLRALDEEVSMTDPGALHHDLTPDGVRMAVAEVLDMTPDQVQGGANLLELGVDSIKLMMLASRWQAHGVEVPFGELAAEPTVDAWARLLREGERCGS